MPAGVGLFFTDSKAREAAFWREMMNLAKCLDGMVQNALKKEQPAFLQIKIAVNKPTTREPKHMFSTKAAMDH